MYPQEMVRRLARTLAQTPVTRGPRGDRLDTRPARLANAPSLKAIEACRSGFPGRRAANEPVGTILRFARQFDHSLMQLKGLCFDKHAVDKALPRFVSRRLEKLNAQWRKAVGDDCGPGMLGQADDSSALDRRKELPSLVRVGTVRPQKTKDAATTSYFAANDFPALLNLRERSALLFHGGLPGAELAEVMQACLLRVTSQLDPSVVQCTVIDLRDFGSAFSIVGSALKDPKIVTDRHEVDQFFRGLVDDLTQRNRARGHSFRYLYQYNRTHTDSPTPYHFIIVASYEEDLRDENKAVLARMLANDNAAKAGIYFLVLHQTDSSVNELRSQIPQLPSLRLSGTDLASASIEVLDPEGLNTASEEFASQLKVVPEFTSASLGSFAERIRRHSLVKHVESVMLPLPDPENWEDQAWKGTTRDGIEAVIGKSRGLPLTFRLGSPEIVHNALVGGAVGTGKTNLLHAIIMQCLATYSPSELRLSLLDYKNGTEFNVYASVPHLYALSLGPSTKFGTDLLQHFKRELERRAELFKKAGVTSLSGYRTRTGETLPRHLVVIDEFQVLLGDRRLGYVAQADLEDMIRRGRAFGFNFILSSQSLKDCTLSPAARSNIGSRICLKLSEADCSDFLSIENMAPSRFQEVGQAILNNQEGRLAGNVEFRVAYYPDQRIGDFCAVLAARDKSDNTAHIYRGDDIYTRDMVSHLVRSGELLMGIEEGIPLTSHTLSLDPGRGPVFGCGSGQVKERFDAHLQQETARGGHKVRYAQGDELEALNLEVQGDAWQACDLLAISIKQRESIKVEVQMGLRQLLMSPPCKMVVYADTAATFRNLILDRNDADYFLCFDQRAYADFAIGGLPLGVEAAALFLPGERDAVMLKIPQPD